MLLVACLSEIVTIAVGKVAEEEDHQMYLRRMVKQALTLGLLVTIVVLALSACKADEWQRESKDRPLPEDPTALYPGDYRSEEFEPSLSSGLSRVGQTFHWRLPTFCKSREERRPG